MSLDVIEHHYKDLLIFLVVAGVVAPLFNRWRINPILGFLSAGVLLGPQGLERLAPLFAPVKWVTLGTAEDLSPLAELGVVFLLFMIGLELSWDRIQTMRRLIFRLGAAQILGSAAVIGLGAATLGQPAIAAAVIGGGAAMSSTALVIPSFAQRKRLTSLPGRAALAILLAQDLAVAPMLVSVSLLGGRGGESAWERIGVPLGVGALALAVIFVGGRLLLRPLFRSAAQAKSPEIFAATSLLIVVGSAAVAAAGGLSMAIGAFVAGLLLAETEFRREVEVVIDPFKGLALGMFFVSAGADLNLDWIVSHPYLVAGATLGIVAAKIAVVLALGRLMRIDARRSAEVALPLGPAGEFALVLVAPAAAAGLIGQDAADVVLVSTGLGLFLVPALAAVGARLAARAPAPLAASLPDAIPPGLGPAEAGVLIVGYGRVGRLVGEMLQAHGRSFTAVDTDPSLVETERAAGVRLYFGDASREAFLKACGVETAAAVVVTMDAPAKVDEVVRTARALRPDLTLIARARDASHAEALYRLGVTDAVPEAIEASLQLAENTLVDLGVPMGLVIASIHEKRDAIRKSLSDGAARGGPVRALRGSTRTVREG
ncbi:MAG TPA: cation:proton antiporter [Caulobacteraceae bacterium]|nr:cation:proton antiporter [Caulobacteraceae bacterium]